MVTTLSMNLPQSAADHVAGVVRLVRQICLLREQGETDRAARLQANDLAAALRDLQAEHGPDALREEGLQALFAAERERVAEAVLLAELLIPQLTGGPRLARSVAPARAPAPMPASAPAAGPPAIPDLLDAMLAAERTGRHPSPVVHRKP